MPQKFYFVGEKKGGASCVFLRLLCFCCALLHIAHNSHGRIVVWEVQNGTTTSCYPPEELERCRVCSRGWSCVLERFAPLYMGRLSLISQIQTLGKILHKVCGTSPTLQLGYLKRCLPTLYMQVLRHS